MQFLQAYNIALVQIGIRLTISSGSPTCRTPYQALISLYWSLWHAVCMQLRLSKLNSEEPQSLFSPLALLCSLELCSYLMYIGAGNGITLMGASWPWSQQSTSACINMSCRSRGTSLCTSILLTCDFIIRKENWDVLCSPHVFSHLKRVCIIWSLRMGFCLEENCVYVCMCLCVWEVCRFLMFGFSSFTKSCSESSTPMNGKAFCSQCNTVIAHLSPFLLVERWI